MSLVQKYSNLKTVYLIPRKWLDRLGSFSGITGKLLLKGAKKGNFQLVFLLETFDLLLGFIFLNKSAFHTVIKLVVRSEKELVTQD